MTQTDKLASLRVKSGLTQAEVAEQLDVSRQAISRWEIGDACPSTENLIQLSRLYHVSLDYLVSDKEEEIEPTPEGTAQTEKDKRKYVFTGLLLGLLIALLGITLFIGAMAWRTQDVRKSTPMKQLPAETINIEDFEEEDFSFSNDWSD